MTSSSREGAFNYDPLGNQLQNGGTYNEINQILEDNEFSYTYTTNGNHETKTSKITHENFEYSWDNENKLTQVVIKNANGSIERSIQHKYDGLGRRTEKVVNVVRNRFVYDGEDIIAEFNENNLGAIFLHGPGIDEPIATLRDVNSDGEFTEFELFFYAKDHLNSVHDLTDFQGRPVQRYNYSAYGKTEVEKTDPVQIHKLVPNIYGYTSREWEQETGDYYYRARNYNPGAGRFLSEDPIGFNSSDYNLYRYVLNNPVRYNDPYGKDVHDGPVALLWCPTNLEGCPKTMTECLVASGLVIDGAEQGNLIQQCGIERRECEEKKE